MVGERSGRRLKGLKKRANPIKKKKKAQLEKSTTRLALALLLCRRARAKLEGERNDKRLARRANCCNGCATCQAPATVLVGCCASATAAIFAECFESARRRRFASTASRKSTNSAKALSVSAKSCSLVCVQSVAQN